MRLIQWNRGQIRALQAYADSYPQQALAVLRGKAPPAGDIPGHVLVLEGGTRVVYSIESDQPLGVSRHLSISVDTKGAWPCPEAVLLLAADLGFRSSFADGTLWQDLENEAINWVQTIEPPVKH